MKNKNITGTYNEKHHSEMHISTVNNMYIRRNNFLGVSNILFALF